MAQAADITALDKFQEVNDSNTGQRAVVPLARLTTTRQFAVMDPRELAAVPRCREPIANLLALARQWVSGHADTKVSCG